ncbi:hypothetical protein F4782DRAFT_113375 [Xylaria castorea]|nr:hypothetical protein F4782DRAFT_113375 [Xylaria castorea]
MPQGQADRALVGTWADSIASLFFCLTLSALDIPRLDLIGKFRCLDMLEMTFLLNFSFTLRYSSPRHNGPDE